MKFILFLPIMLALTACQDAEFKAGECIQKPDETFRYRINSVDSGVAQLEALNGGVLEETKLGSDNWIRTNCD